LLGQLTVFPTTLSTTTEPSEERTPTYDKDFQHVLGHQQAKRVLKISAAAGLHVLMAGPPGCGKSLLAETFPLILPPLKQESRMEGMGIHCPFYLRDYCLMTNDIPLQLETIHQHIKHIMKMLNLRYAIYFNKRHKLGGPVFQGRYEAEILETKGYQLEVSRYIHLNPVEANRVANLADYRWSSYRAYVMSESNFHVNTDERLGYFSEPVKDRVPESLWRERFRPEFD
jgi:energy-coupling factor transporter ATP-binding protein EcfA2